MDRIWAPWRIEYIKKQKTVKCILCTIPKEPVEKDRENLLLYRGEKAFVMMNRYPYNNGHLMIAPYRHIESIVRLSSEEVLEIYDLIRLSIKTLEKAMHPHGFNIGANIGEAAGAGIKDHFHIHIVPRWVGDTNFMPILANIKIMVEYLDETYMKLKREMMKITVDDERFSKDI